MILEDFKKKKIVVFSGAGVSAESGISTFRDKDGLWDNYDPKIVASARTWYEGKDAKEYMLDFYNERRRQLDDVEPNVAHKYIAKLEDFFDVTVITQNVDDLHERAGSSDILHLHGELRKSRSTVDPKLIYDCDKDILLGDKCEKGSQLRPHVVWFGEDVPEYNNAVKITKECDLLIVVGTSLNVYPAANLLSAVDFHTKIFVVDKDRSVGTINEFDSFGATYNTDSIINIVDDASTGMEKLYGLLMSNLDLDFPDEDYR